MPVMRGWFWTIPDWPDPVSSDATPVATRLLPGWLRYQKKSPDISACVAIHWGMRRLIVPGLRCRD